MILTKEMAEKAKVLVRTFDISFCEKFGVCRVLDVVSDRKIDVYEYPTSFWDNRHADANSYRWPNTPEGDEKRRIFIDSLIGKDL